MSGNLFFERSNLLFNVLLWPACLLLHLFMLRGVDDERPRRWWPVVHVGNVLLMILMAATILDRAIDLGQLRGTDWAAGILLTACTSAAAGAGVRSRLDRYASRLAARPLPAPVRTPGGRWRGDTHPRWCIDRGLHSAGQRGAPTLPAAA